MKKLFTLLLVAATLQSAVAQNFGVVLFEDFETATIPTGWTQTVSTVAPTGASSTVTSSGWAFGQTGYSSSYWTVPASIDASQFTIANDDVVDQNRNEDLLISPVLNLAHFDSAIFLYDVFYNGEWGSAAYFFISYDAGANWLNVAINDSAVWAEDGILLPRTITVSGTPYTFNDQMRIGFFHTDGGGWADGFAVDNVIVAGFNNPCDDIVTIPACGAAQTVSLGGQGVDDFNFTGPCTYPVPGAEQLYSFTPTVTGVHTLQVTSATGNSWLDYMYKPASSGCDSLGWTCIGDINAVGTFNLNLTAGVEYLLLLDNEFSDTETQSFSIECPSVNINPCLTAASTYNDLNTAGAAPCNDGNGCVPTDPDFTSISIGVYGSEAYLLDNVQAGFDYVFDMCTGFGAGSWIPEITIVAPDGTTVDAWNGEAATGSSLTFLDQCSLGWTASQSGTYTILINQLGTAAGDAPDQTGCSSTYAVDNGNPTVYCGANQATCVACEAGSLTSAAVQDVCPGQTFEVALSGNSTPGTYSLFFDNSTTGGTGGTEAPVTITGYAQGDFPLSVDEDINGVLSFNSLPPLAGSWLVKVIVVDAVGADCDSTDAFTVNFLEASDPLCMTVGVEENETTEVNVYPNPSNGNVTMEMENVVNHADMFVFDVAGREVFAQRIAANGRMKHELNLDLTAGTYLLKLVSGGQSHLTRIVVQ